MAIVAGYYIMAYKVLSTRDKRYVPELTRKKVILVRGTLQLFILPTVSQKIIIQ